MAEEEKEEQQEGRETGKGKKSILKWIIIAVAVVVLGAGAAGGWYYYSSVSKGNEAPEEEKVVTEPGIWSLGSMVVNLMDNNGERYLKTNIQIEVSGQECLSELESLRPKIIDNILVLLSSKSYREIAGFEGKQSLRDDIAVRVNRYLTKGQVMRIYFTEFLIQ
jgi:flagellar FliL protein